MFQAKRQEALALSKAIVKDKSSLSMQEMDIRYIKTSDYEGLSSWWDAWRWGEGKPSLELLDNLNHGIIISENGINICSGFLYFTNAVGFGLIECIISNFYVIGGEKRKEVLILLICSLQEVAKKQGIEVLFSSLRSENLKKHYLDCGFQAGSKNTTEMVCRLK